MAVAEDLAWFARDEHFKRRRDGYYRNLVAEATRLGFDTESWSRIAKQVGCSVAVVDAILNGGVEPTFAQYRALNEALRTAVAPGPVLDAAALNGASAHG